MNNTGEFLRPQAASKFKLARNSLLPNEDVRFVCQIRKGFLVFSNRRVAVLRQEKESHFNIERVIPYDCVLSIRLESDSSAKITGIPLDMYGCYELERTVDEVIDIKAPKPRKGEDKHGVRSHFQTAMKYALSVLDEIMESTASNEEPTPLKDFSYLDSLPKSLTRDAILDLNTILQDMPIHDELYNEAMKFLGNDPFILEESLRDGRNEDNGVLFAAGKQGYIWIQGTKDGRYMANVLVDKVEWNNIKCFAHRWQTEDNKIEATYSLQRDSKELSIRYQWSPTINEDTTQYPWLLQKLNGPWILADVMYKYSGRPLPASWVSVKHLKQPELHSQRYYH